MPKNEKNVREITEKKAQKAAQARRAAESDVPSNLPLLVSGSLLVLVVAVLVLVMQQAPTEAAGQDDDAVTLLDLHARCFTGWRGCHYRTSGANDTMRMNCLSRSSRPTGPKIRVPRGWC